MNENMVEIEHLRKSFGNVKAVNDLSFQVKYGELFAFLGINGAGKSTTISMICGQLTADSGTIHVNGQDVRKHSHEIKENIGVVFQDSVLDKPLTARENLKSRAALYGITGKNFGPPRPVRPRKSRHALRRCPRRNSGRASRAAECSSNSPTAWRA